MRHRWFRLAIGLVLAAPFFLVAGARADSCLFAAGDVGLFARVGDAMQLTFRYPSTGYEGVWMSAPNDIFVVGFEGARWILHFNGDAWSLMDCSKECPAGGLHGVWGTSASDVYAVGSKILHYDGSSWSIVPYDPGSPLYAVWGTSPTNVYAVGNQKRIHYYDGSGWKLVLDLGAQYFRGIWGSSESDIFAVGDYGQVMHFDGVSWSNMTTPIANNLYTVWGSSGSDVYAAGTVGVMVHYDGASWTTVPIPATRTIRSIWGSSASDIFAVEEGTNNIYHYDGVSWTQMWNPDSRASFGMFGTSGSSVYAVGSGGAIVRYDGAAWARVLSGQPLVRAVWANYFCNKAWAVADSGHVLRYDGGTWNEVASGTTTDLTGVWGTGLQTVYVCGENGLIRRTTNDGLTWSTVATGTLDLYAIRGSSAVNIYAVGSQGIIVHYDGSGWSTARAPVEGESLEDVWVNNQYDIWAVGWYYAEPIHDFVKLMVHGDGSSWTTSYVGPGELRSVWGSSEFDVYAVGDNDIFHYDGIGWSQLGSPSGEVWTGICGVSAEEVYICGQSGTISAYDGSAWQDVVTGDGRALRDIWSIERDPTGAPAPRLAELVSCEAFPNPFNPSTIFRYVLPTSGRVTLDVYDGVGRHVACLADREEQQGAHEVLWRGVDSAGKPVGSGVYLYRLTFKGGSASGKVVLIR